MKSILEYTISHSNLGLLPSIGVVVLFCTLIAIYVWTFIPKHKAQYEQDAKLVFDLEKGDH